MGTQHLDPTPRVSCRYGAPMGRRERHGDPDGSPAPRFYLRRVPINSGGYDSGGAYWGIGTPLYWASCPEIDAESFFRAFDRATARATIRREYPGAKFYR